MSKAFKEALIEATKEFFRVVILAILPVLITGLESGIFNVKAVFIVGAIAGLKWVDSFMHEWGKTGNTEIKNLAEPGLTRF